MAKTPVPVPRRAAKMGLSYRKAGEADQPFLFEVYAATRREEVALAGWPAAEQASFLDMQARAQHAHYHAHYPDAAWLVIQIGVAPVGRLYLEHWPSQHRIIDIALLPAFRRRGFGEAILRDLMADAAKAGKTLSIHVERTNPAMRLYRRLGFETVEEKGVYELMEWQGR